MSPEEGSEAQRFLTVFGNVYAGWEHLSIRTFFLHFFFCIFQVVVVNVTASLVVFHMC